TNDGDLAAGLMRAASNVQKTYVVKIAGQPEESGIAKLRSGVSIAMKGARRAKTRPAKIRLIRKGENTSYEVTLTDGKNRQIRKIVEESGYHGEKIKRLR